MTHVRTSARLCLLALALALSQGILQPAFGAQSAGPDWTSRVLKVVVTRSDGTLELGSALPLAADLLVTNCHVLRQAEDIVVEWRGRTYRAIARQGDAYRDLCLLTVAGLDAEPMPMIEMGQTRVGLEVVAVGYSKGRFAATQGKVMGLHACECDGGKVVQTSAPFDHGASGGGLFDQQGRLVGILTFKARAGGNFHFALPVGWLRHLAEGRAESVAASNTFWEQPGKESGYFLSAGDLSARQEWRGLKKLASEWTAKEPHNPEAWMALGHARQGLRQGGEAVNAFQNVLMLDSTHAEAKWALQQLEFDLGLNLADASSV